MMNLLLCICSILCVFATEDCSKLKYQPDACKKKDGCVFTVLDQFSTPWSEAFPTLPASDGRDYFHRNWFCSNADGYDKFQVVPELLEIDDDGCGQWDDQPQTCKSKGSEGCIWLEIVEYTDEDITGGVSHSIAKQFDLWGADNGVIVSKYQMCRTNRVTQCGSFCAKEAVTDGWSDICDSASECSECSQCVALNALHAGRRRLSKIPFPGGYSQYYDGNCHDFDRQPLKCKTTWGCIWSEYGVWDPKSPRVSSTNPGFFIDNVDTYWSCYHKYGPAEQIYGLTNILRTPELHNIHDDPECSAWDDQPEKCKNSHPCTWTLFTDYNPDPAGPIITRIYSCKKQVFDSSNSGTPYYESDDDAEWGTAVGTKDSKATAVGAKADTCHLYDQQKETCKDKSSECYWAELDTYEPVWKGDIGKVGGVFDGVAERIGRSWNCLIDDQPRNFYAQNTDADAASIPPLLMNDAECSQWNDQQEKCTTTAPCIWSEFRGYKPTPAGVLMRYFFTCKKSIESRGSYYYDEPSDTDCVARRAGPKDCREHCRAIKKEGTVCPDSFYNCQPGDGRCPATRQNEQVAEAEAGLAIENDRLKKANQALRDALKALN